MFQLWSRDEYGQGSILSSGENTKELLNRAKYNANDDNMNNALTAEEKGRSWESFCVEFIDDLSNPISNMIYGGTGPGGKHIVYIFEGEELLEVPLDHTVAIPRFFIGVIDGAPAYACDERKNLILSFKHQNLQGKTAYFLRKA